MTMKNVRAFLAVGALATACASYGCVADRPARNGVYNENQYLRKDFIIRPGDNSQPDPGWMLKATITEVSTPNPLGSSNFGIFSGSENGGSLVRFAVTQDKLQMLSMREMSTLPAGEQERTPEVLNSWPVTNVDLKYRVNLDGEKTNFYEENQELDWQVRQWVKLSFDKNDMSDIAPFGSYETALLAKCTDTANYATTLVPNSFNVDEPNNYMEWKVQITMPLNWADATCQQAFGVMADAAGRLGRQSVTMNLKYSMVRANPAPTYQPLLVQEKDPIRHKYGFFDWITTNRDPSSGLLAAQQLVTRFDPTKPITWYFAPGFPEDYKHFFVDPNGIADQTNQLFKDSNAAARLSFLNYNDATTYQDAAGPSREYGDVRYSFLRWMSDEDMQDGFAGVTQFVVDPRTGEALSSSISFNDFAIKDYYVQRIDAYLQSVGATSAIDPKTGNWVNPPGSCKDGDTIPIVPATVIANHNGTSTLYQKMQQYLGKPPSTFGNLGPQDFVVNQDDDFFRAYYALLPYYVYADPDMNPFVIREGGQGVLGPSSVWPMLQQEAAFQQSAANIDRGLEPYQGVTGPMGITAATQFLNTFKAQTMNHNQLTYLQPFIFQNRHMDPPTAFSFEQIISRDARHCVTVNGATHWETKDEWTQSLISTYWSQVAWHVFGHSLGLVHNFMASIDKNNFPHYMDGAGRDHVGLYSNSVMEYNAAPDRIFWHAGWAPYDQGAISWIYANGNGVNNPVAPTMPGTAQGISGQLSPTYPWFDPHGFKADGKTETQYLFCTHQHLKYTPFCREGDSGTTPSEIMANEIDAYEWQYKWRNFRTYRKIWDNSAYANGPAGIVTDMRKFLSLWIFDWNSTELADSLRRIGINNPDPNGSNLEYYQQLTNKFNADASMANQMVAAFHKAIIQESNGERPYRTIYDPYYGDVTQQGIILDKLFAMQGWVGLWPSDNYDQNQAGTYISSYGVAAGLDSSYQAVAEDAVDSMIGGQYDAYPYFVPLAVAQFSQDTHSPNFSGRIEVRDWVGGHTFSRLDDFLAFFRDIAVKNGTCTDVASCTYDPRGLSDTHNQFFGPDQRVWIWAYVPDRNTWVAVEKERNTASYIIVRNYTDDVIYQQDDGAFPGGAYGAELPMKFFLDSFNMYN